MKSKLRLVFCLSYLLLAFNLSCQDNSDKDHIEPTSTSLAPTTLPPSVSDEKPAAAGDGSSQSCSRPLESKSTAVTCEVTHKSSGGFTYLEGTLLAPAGTITNGALIYDSLGVIQCTGCDCYDTALKVDATRISCPQGIISPGLINSHDHLSWANVRPQSPGTERFEHRNDWRGGKRNHKKLSIPSGGSDPEVTFGEIRQLMVGTVSIAGSNG
ncbi:MAG: hypothetical protein EOP09_17450, partial [Proteobacteria bacterium]